MSSWYTFAILALFLMGTQRFLYKVSAERNYNTAWTTFAFMATVSVLSSMLFVALDEPIKNIEFLLVIALLNSGAFLVATVTHIESLKHIPASIAFPVIRLNVVIVVLFSIYYFNDHPSLYQGIGIVLAITAIVILTRELSDKETSYGSIKRGAMCVFISLLCGALATISSKFAAIRTNTVAFIAVSYILSTLFSFGLRKKLETEETKKNQKDALIIGVAMGVINFAGYYSFLKALSMGPLSIIASITGMHFVIAIILSGLVYQEQLTRWRIIGISLTIFSIILLRF
jgi:drug/metabolite transporter (DMT)-like permease